MKRRSLTFFIFILIIFTNQAIYAQLSALGSVGSDKTNYTSFPETDSIFIFCVQNETIDEGELQVTTQLSGTKTFLWEVYNNQTASFDLYSSESSSAQTSSISGLENGCYRATVTQGSTTEVYRAWVFNNWILPEASITDSNCESFKLNGSFTSSDMIYYDLSSNSEINVFKDMKMQWKDGEVIVATVQNPQIYDPPTSDTEYTLQVYDRFGCESNVTVTYESIVTKAGFTVDANWSTPGSTKGEAPLEVSFINTSENGDPNGYEWFFFKDLNQIKRESENSQEPIDSFIVVAYDQNPVYTYQNTGAYMVKLVSKKESEFQTCTDTFYLEDYIVVDSSYIKAPNVFTPDGNGVNDEFIVKFVSMQSIKISIFNRWGQRIHFWEDRNVQGFDNSSEASVWDGKIGGRYASPGVYYYVVEGRGRDGKMRRANGFVHLFRGKD